MQFKVIIHEDEEGGFWAEVPALKGCVSEGDSYNETLDNIKEAIEGWLESQNVVSELDEKSKVVEVSV
ncbi:MAG: type II toxin-antitoxin system HicB family antitoxin [Spirochaetota bacterium]|nr:type II toxin-antitoxin system HicB family antitoxin [Spirochaetota bacterium]